MNKLNHTWINRYQLVPSSQYFFSPSILLINELISNQNWCNRVILFWFIQYIPSIFEKADILDQHALIREVFKHDITYSDGACRTLSMNPMFTHNVFEFKEKGLLFLEQPSSKMEVIPIRTGNDEFFEHLSGFMEVLERILEKKKLQNEV